MILAVELGRLEIPQAYYGLPRGVEFMLRGAKALRLAAIIPVADASRDRPCACEDVRYVRRGPSGRTAFGRGKGRRALSSGRRSGAAAACARRSWSQSSCTAVKR